LGDVQAFVHAERRICALIFSILVAQGVKTQPKVNAIRERAKTKIAMHNLLLYKATTYQTRL
jgi:hypothetical protein